MKSLAKVAGVALLLAACGQGDGPPTMGVAGEHPVLATCERYTDDTLVTCSEFRGITDSDWDIIANTCEFQADAVCPSTRENRGACRVAATTGMKITTWHYECGANQADPDCAKQPSTIQADCQTEGGTYIPPDEAG
jgi:hypothetical protein